MNTIVTKFGGSSLADSIHFKKVKNIIEGNSESKYEIPSAPGKRFSKDFKVTDLPVSYTHLDVYKRQSINSTGEPSS